MNHKSSRKLVPGLVASLLVAVFGEILMACAYSAFEVMTLGHGIEKTQGIGLALIALGVMYVSGRIALVTVALVGLVYVTISSKLKRLSALYCVLSGAAIGLGDFGVMIFGRLADPAPPLQIGLDEYFLAISATISGAVAGLAFWAVMRPDNRTREQSG